MAPVVTLEVAQGYCPLLKRLALCGNSIGEGSLRSSSARSSSMSSIGTTAAMACSAALSEQIRSFPNTLPY